jgi:hypothetical protein
VAAKSKIPSPHSHYRKIANLPGFRFLVSYTRVKLNLPGMTPNQFASMSTESMYRAITATWAIMDLFNLPSQDQEFVENAILWGFDQALKMNPAPHVRILIPELDRALAHQLAVDFAQVVMPRSQGSWLTVTRNSKSTGGRVFGAPPDDQGETTRATVIRGPGGPCLVIRNGPRIYLDVTDASKEDIERAMPLVNQLRRELQLQNPSLKVGAPARRDEDKAVDAALLHLEGAPYVDIGRKFGWRIYDEDVATGTCPTAVKYVKLGKEILKKIIELEKTWRELAESEQPGAGTQG